MSVVQRFAEAISEEIQEVRRKSRAAKFDVRNGERLEDDGSAVAYGFEASSSQRLKEDTAIILIMPDGDRLSGTVLSHKGGEIRVSLERDVGEGVPEAQMMTDDTFLLEKMREAVLDSASGEREIDLDMAFKAIGEAPIRAGEVPAEAPGLNEDQARALRVALGSEVSFLWGPPGTGKTATLGKLVHEMFRRNMTVLIVSNANLAVDTLLERVCADLAKSGELQPGAVVRYGTPVRESMVASFGEFILPGHVFDREHPGFDAEMNAAEMRIAELMRMRQGAAAKASALPEIERRREEVRRTARACKMAEAELTGISQKIVKLELQMTGWRMKIGKFPEKEVRALISEAESEIIGLEDVRDEVMPKVEAARRAARTAEDRLASIEPASGSDALSDWDTMQAEIDDLGTKVRRGRERKAEFAKILAQRAQIVAATAYQGYLATLKKGGFDAVVIDEASMLPLPLVFLSAGLARRHVVIAGDFRQLPTVAVSEAPVVKEFYARDPFVKSGIAAGADAGRLPAHAVALRTQYRMRRDICELINQPFYNGILRTPEGQHEDRAERGVFTGSTLTMLDFRALQPWGMRKVTGSRMNPWQAVGLAACGAILKKSGEWSGDAGEFGVITAYAAQAEALNDCLRELGGFGVWPAATIHKFQGSEKDTIVFEVADGRGVRLGGFFKGTADGIDQRLLNVAFSRARKRVVLVGNGEYLEREAVRGSAFSKLFAVFRDKARRIDAAAMIGQLGESVGVTLMAPPEARGAIQAEIEKSRTRFEIFLSGWRIKELLAVGTTLKVRLMAGAQGVLRIDPGAEQAMVQEPRIGALVQELVSDGLVVELAPFSGQEAGLLIDRKHLWLIPAGGFGSAADTIPFMRADLPQFGARLVSAVREGCAPWAGAGRGSRAA